MNRATSATGWVRNPDGSLGWTWNPITGCLNGCEYCYARKLANGRLRSRYIPNDNIATVYAEEGEPYHKADKMIAKADPFYPRFWEDRLQDVFHRGETQKPRGIFACDMSDLFGIGIPTEWTQKVMDVIELCPHDRFYLLTKQPQNLPAWSPFPQNAWVGVTATNPEMITIACDELNEIQAKVRYLSIEPLLSWAPSFPLGYWLEHGRIDQVIIGSQTKPRKLPKWEWVAEIIEACDRADVPVFLKDNLGLPKLNCDGAAPFYKPCPSGTREVRQELPNEER